MKTKFTFFGSSIFAYMALIIVPVIPSILELFISCWPNIDNPGDNYVLHLYDSDLYKKYVHVCQCTSPSSWSEMFTANIYKLYANYTQQLSAILRVPL